MDHADGVVQSLPIHRQTGVPFLGHHLDDFGQGHPTFDGDDIGTGNHYVFRRPVSQIEDVGQQVAFVVVEGDLGLVTFPHQFVEGIASRSFAVARPGKNAQDPAHPLPDARSGWRAGDAGRTNATRAVGHVFRSRIVHCGRSSSGG